MKKLVAILAMLTFLSPPLFASAGQEIVPNGVSRIGTIFTPNCVDVESEEGKKLLAKDETLEVVNGQVCTPPDYSAVGVAVVDTGIALDIPDLNVVGGVDCTNAGGSYFAERSSTPGAQRSIWEPDPDTIEREKRAANISSTHESSSISKAPTDDQGRPVVGPDGIFSLYGYEFTIQTVGDNPAEMGGRNPNAKGYEDGNGHGTHVAGIIGAIDDGQGLVGVAPNARLYAVRVLDSGGSGTLDNVVCGLDWVAANAEDEEIHVVNMSLGLDTGQRVMDMTEDCDSDEKNDPNFVVKSGKLKDEFHEAVCDVVDAGVAIVVAAGNGWGDSATTIPAAYPEVITVSNFADFDGLPGGLADPEDTACPHYGGNDDEFWSHLNGSPTFGYGSYGGETIDFAAPGVCVLSTFPGGMQSLTGTSMAAPHVAGAMARLIADSKEVVEDDSVFGQDRAQVEYFRQALIANGEPQTEEFNDNDNWHEPLVHVDTPIPVTPATVALEAQEVPILPKSHWDMPEWLRDLVWGP